MPAHGVLAGRSEPGSRSERRSSGWSWRGSTPRTAQSSLSASSSATVMSTEFPYIRNALTVKDFRPLLGFEDLHASYQRGGPVPAVRAARHGPPAARLSALCEALGLEGEPGPWEQIARSQGRREGDTIQLFPEPVGHGR